MTSPKLQRHPFIQFLQTELAVPEESIAMALKYADAETNPLHMILWQYGLVTVEQLGQIFDWLLDHAHVAQIFD